MSQLQAARRLAPLRLGSSILIVTAMALLGGCLHGPIGSSPPAREQGCEGSPLYAAAAAYNGAAVRYLVFSPFGRRETGFQIYGPLIQMSLGTRCGAASLAFAEAVARLQREHGLAPSGALTPETFVVLKGLWQERRPFVRLRLTGVCPKGADVSALEAMTPGETLGGKIVRLDPGALAALRRMTASARREDPAIAADPALLTAFSGYRSPEADAQRCETEKNCQGVTRALCSAHRTGLAADLYVGSAEGFEADSSADANRLVQSEGAAYLWLVRNAARFGFVNYAFEPWHWEWIGTAP
jgi:hypothetical protein